MAYAPTAGKRVGLQDNIDTICEKLITSEPYIGHAQYDPEVAAAQKGNISLSNLSERIPPGAYKLGDKKPGVVNTPDGVKVGIGYRDEQGKLLTDASNTLTDPAGAITDLTGNPADLLGGLPQYSNLLGIENNFRAALETDFLALSGLGNMVESIKNVMPPIRMPTLGPLAAEAIGYAKLLTELESQLKQFAVDATGLAGDLAAGKFAQMQEKISQAKALAGSPAELESLLAANGINKLDIPGESIFQDKFGNTVVDVTNGIGPVGATLGLTSDLATTFDQVKDAISVPLSENQSLAISKFANSIGAERFKTSNVLQALNDGLYDEVPRLMQGWTLAPNSPGGSAVPQAYLEGERQAEAALFQAPDSTGLRTADFGGTGGEITYAELAEDIIVQVEDLVVRYVSS